MQALHTAATGMAAQELNVQVISNNIANLRTTGYKKQTASFQDLIYEHVRRVGAQASDQGTILPVGIDIGGGVKTVGTPRSMTQGTLSQTGNDLDLAITGEGFFKILMPDGTYQYSRDGTFQMDNQGRVVTAQGNPVQPSITVPQNASGLTVNAQGQVSVTLPGASNTSTIIGQIGLTRFINKAGLQPVGSNLFTDTPASGAPQDGLASAEGYGTITQGSLEQANVDVVSEMSDLIAAQRAYEMNAKVISAADQMMQSTAALFR
jgi:flagellar basal-body rod protein FlgG